MKKNESRLGSLTRTLPDGVQRRESQTLFQFTVFQKRIWEHFSSIWRSWSQSSWMVFPRSFYVPEKANSSGAGTHPGTSVEWTSVRSEDINKRDRTGRDKSGELIQETWSSLPDRGTDCSKLCNDPPPMTQYCPLLAPHIRLPRRSPILGLLSQRLA
jgi:hypothetical protein